MHDNPIQVFCDKLDIKMRSILFLLCLVSVCSAQTPCLSKGSVSPRISFCTNSFGISNVTFNADPEVRSYNGTKYMSFTSLTFSDGLPHLFFARWIPQQNCWGDIHKITFDEQNTPLAIYNEVSTFFINGTKIFVYYLHYTKATPSSDYDPETMSTRLKVGDLLSDGTIFGFGTEVIFPTTGFNTFVLWANANSPDLPYALNQAFGAACYPPSEPSVFRVSETSYYMSLGCLTNFASLKYGIFMIHADNPVFQNSTVQKILQVGDYCAGSYPLGFQAGSIIRYNDTFYLAASPLNSTLSDYNGCVFYKFNNNLLDAGLDKQNPYGQIQFGIPHSGSCSGGAGSMLPVDKEVDSNIVYFYQQNTSAWYYLQSSTFPTPAPSVSPSPSRSPSSSPASSASPSSGSSVSPSSGSSASPSSGSSVSSSPGSSGTSSTPAATASASPADQDSGACAQEFSVILFLVVALFVLYQ